MRLHAQWRIASINAHSATPKRSSSPSIRSNVISNGNTAIVVHPMIAARVSNNRGTIRSGSDGLM
jgi:hypothetical protein